ncbi:MAG: class I SAM-dependent methyltransferase [Thermoanaerobaculia bacterium]|nr:class I SAM-dependent methyltransferase [Thermoanaerobaculia bacterium]
MPQEKQYYYETLGEDFEGFMSNYDVDRRLHLVFDDLLAGIEWQGKRVLEVGAGTGRFSRELVTRGAELTVLDIGAGLTRRVAASLASSGVAADACYLPFKDNSFDVVVSSECIEHTTDPLAAVVEMTRVTKDSGTVCLTTPNRLWYPTVVVANRIRVRRYCGIENWVWPGDVRRVMQQEGFQCVRFSGCHLWPFQLEVSRPLLQRLDRFAPLLYRGMINFGVAASRVSSESTAS